MKSSNTFSFSIIVSALLCLTLLGCSSDSESQPPQIKNSSTPKVSNFRASAQVINLGEKTILSWSNATPGARLILLPNDVDVTNLSSYTVQPKVSTDYTLQVTKEGLTESYKITVSVKGSGDSAGSGQGAEESGFPDTPPNTTPPSERGLASSKTLVAVGETIGFAWNLTGTEDVSCTFTPGDGASYDLPDCATNTSQAHVYTSPGAYVATLRVVGPDSSETFKVYPTVATFDENAFNIDVVFLDDDMSASQRAVFEAAAARWAQVISADVGSFGSNTYECGERGSFVGAVDDLVIMASAPSIDGRGGTLGAAGPCAVNRQTGQAIYGVMKFDRADLDWLEQTGSLQDTILHEMGHVLGIGTLWAYNTLINEAAYAYTGQYALDEYRDLRGNSKTSVPTENNGGPGTANGHWEEDEFNNELMTGFLNSGSNPLSKVTIGTLEDLGYSVNYAAADEYSMSTVSLTPLSTSSGPQLHSVPVEQIEILEY